MTRRWAWFAGGSLAAAVLPFLVPHPFLFGLLIQASIWALVAASWDVLGGYAGQLSFGHSGFFALGGYAVAGLALHLGISPWLGIAAAILLCAVVGLVVGFPALRLRGHYLGLVTLGFAEIVRLVSTNWLEVTGGPFGLHDFGSFPGLPSDPLQQREATYLIVLGFVAAGVAVMLYLCEETDAGRAFRAIREDQLLAQSHGINVSAWKLCAFTLSAGLTGLAGALYALSLGLVNPNLALPLTSALIVGMAVCGVLGTIWGPVVGAVLLFLMTEGLRFVGVVYNLIAVGLVIMVFVIFVPRGIAGIALASRGRVLRRDALQRQVGPHQPGGANRG
jgi:branched-chain amino acid transport system permease protein